ncbi:hypothetical protein [Streptomyces sp. NPDC006638]|uniref:hypothetical protein n=1 Tax=Streptomyces sp. NPDC006638 TaxID=3157183 RepID=UPI0033A95645
MEHNDVHRDGGTPLGGPVVLIDCTPRTGITRQDLEVLDRWTPHGVGRDPEAVAGKERRLRHIARTLYESWLRPLRVRSEDVGGGFVFTHPAAGVTVLECCARHTLHVDVWDTCDRLRVLAGGDLEQKAGRSEPPVVAHLPVT